MKMDYFEIDKGLFDENSSVKFKALIGFEEHEQYENFIISEEFKNKELFLEDLFSVAEVIPKNEAIDEKKALNEVMYSGSDVVFLKAWKNVENISARLIDNYDNSVILECLIDKENGIYEERQFNDTLFNGYELKVGNLFLLRVFERQNEIRIEIHNDPDLTLSDDFPKLSFVESFKNSRLINKK